MTELGKKVDTGSGPSKGSETWFNLYSQQFSAVMKAASEGDTDTACEKMKDLSDWVDRNPPQ